MPFGNYIALHIKLKLTNYINPVKLLSYLVNKHAYVMLSLRKASNGISKLLAKSFTLFQYSFPSFLVNSRSYNQEAKSMLDGSSD